MELAELPTREFAVLVNGQHHPEVVRAHVPKVDASGMLELQSYKGEQLWTVRMYAPGSWRQVNAVVPTDDDIEKFTLVAAEQRRQQEMNQRIASSLAMPGQGRRQ